MPSINWSERYAADSSEIKNFTATGFDLVGYDDAGSSWAGTNLSGSTYVSWCFRAGGQPDLTSSPTKPFAKNGVQYETLSAANITAGTITPTAMSVNTDAGFSIVKYTGTGSSATVPHGLSSNPEMVICKTLDTVSGTNWVIYFKGCLLYTSPSPRDS